MNSYWNIQRLYNDVISDHDTCLQWCEEKGLLPIRRQCSEGHEMLIVQSKSYFGQFRCSKKHSTGKVITLSRTRGTLFEGKKVSPEKVLIMIYCFAHDLTYHDCITESSIDGNMTSKETVFEYYSFFRELITQHYLESTSSMQVGGKDKVVEILELSLNRRKFNIGSYGEDTCIVVMVEQDSKNFCVEICHESGWNTENLLSLIRKNVVKGSIILPNENRDYSLLFEDGYIVQNSVDQLNCKDPISENSSLEHSPGESLQCRKNDIPKEIGVDKLLEFLYKYNVKKENSDPFEALLYIICHRFKQ